MPFFRAERKKWTAYLKTMLIYRCAGSFHRKKKTVNLSYAAYENSEESTKPPILIFHGILSNKSRWEDIGKTLLSLTGRKVVNIDLRNHGNSPHASSHKYIEQAYDVLKLCNKLGVRQASLIGHGVGGRVAMCFALIAPLKVAGLLVVDISPTSTPPSFVRYMPKVLTAMATIDFKNTKKLTQAIIETKQKMSDILSDAQLLTIILSNIKVKADGTIGWICNLDVLLQDCKYWTSFPKVLNNRQYNGPTLFIGGQLSEFIPPDDLNDIRILFPKAVVIYLRDTGHFLHKEDPVNFLQMTITFLRRHNYRDSKHLYQ